MQRKSCSPNFCWAERDCAPCSRSAKGMRKTQPEQYNAFIFIVIAQIIYPFTLKTKIYTHSIVASKVAQQQYHLNQHIHLLYSTMSYHTLQRIYPYCRNINIARACCQIGSIVAVARQQQAAVKASSCKYFWRKRGRKKSTGEGPDFYIKLGQIERR